MSTTVGVIGLSDLVTALEQAGVEVVTGSTVKAAAGEIKARNEQVGTFPILVEDSNTPGLLKWATAVASIPNAPVVAVLSPQRTHVTAEAITHIQTPTTLSEIGGTLGVAINSDAAYPAEGVSAEPEDGLPDFEDEAPATVTPSPTVNWDSTATDHTADEQQAPAASLSQTSGPASSVNWDSTAATPAPRSAPSPAKAPASAPTPQPRPAPTVDPYRDGLYADQAERVSAEAQEMFNAPKRRSMAPVVTVFSGKGGVGKSSLSIQLATTAAAKGKRTILVDGNRGQGDISKYLALSSQKQLVTPTIADYLDHGDITRLILGAETLTKLRPDEADEVPEDLGVLLAPGHKDERLSEVDANIYMQVISQLREHCDLLVVDTQIVEADDRSGMVTNMIVPLLVDGGFGLGISGTSGPSLRNLTERLNLLATAGVDRGRMLLTVNMSAPDSIPKFEKFMRDKIDGKLGVFLGVIGKDERVEQLMNHGELDLRNKEFDQIVNQTLLWTTGAEQFEVAAPKARGSAGKQKKKSSPPKKGGSSKKPGLLARLFGRGE